jgi:phospholipid-binding lipoprotein MlaA
MAGAASRRREAVGIWHRGVGRIITLCHFSRRSRLWLLVGTLLLASAPIEIGAEERKDPLKPFNRRMQTFNDFMDRHLLRPIAKGYQFITPKFVDRAVSNFFGNIGEPRVVVNQVLQGKPVLAGRDTARFLMNTVFGLGGLIDVATKVGLDAHEEDFGQTLGVWGAPSGPYLVLPFFGSSSVRDGAGSIVDLFTWPIRYIDNSALRWSLTGLYIVDLRAGLLSAEELISGDRYVFLRETYVTRREYLVRDGQVEDPFLDEEY